MTWLWSHAFQIFFLSDFIKSVVLVFLWIRWLELLWPEGRKAISRVQKCIAFKFNSPRLCGGLGASVAECRLPSQFHDSLTLPSSIYSVVQENTTHSLWRGTNLALQLLSYWDSSISTICNWELRLVAMQERRAHGDYFKRGPAGLNDCLARMSDHSQLIPGVIHN